MNKKELIDIIVEASEKQLTTLDLHGKGIQDLPSEITRLDCLENLNLSDNALSELPTEIGNLSKLHSWTFDKLKKLA
jgi:Leucine-rich repeat (LRR) protein